MFSFLLKQPSTLSTILHIAEYKIICAVSPPIPSQIFVLKGLANLLATMLLSSIAEWLTIVRRRKKNKEEEDRLVSLPPSLCKNFLPLISSFFSITKGSFHCCQLNESLCVLHPFPTHYSLSLTVSLAAAVSSSSSLCVSPFKYSFCENAVCFLQLRSLKEGSCFFFFFCSFKIIHVALSWLKRCARGAEKCFLVDHITLSTVRLLKGIHTFLNLQFINLCCSHMCNLLEGSNWDLCCHSGTKSDLLCQ